jgi:hypothetical protein
MTTSNAAGHQRVVEPSAAGRGLPDSPFTSRHRLTDHPLFAPERIRKLLQTLPRDKIEVRGVQHLGEDDGSFKRGPMLRDVDPVAAFDRMGDGPTWMLLHDTWVHDPEYRELLEHYVGDLREHFDDMAGDLTDLGCWMFLSSGQCVVHFHADPDQSFLNQIRGSKTVYVYSARTLPEQVIENLVWTSDQGAVVYRPEYEAQSFEPVHLAPGEAVFLPLFAPHRVTNDPGVSVSWNVGFHTPRSRRRKRTHMVNLEMRHVGLHPRPFDARPKIDSLKSGVHFPLQAKNRIFSSLKPRVEV